MREIRRAEDAERTDPPHAAPVTAPDHPGVVRRPWSDLELPDTDDRDDPPIGGPLSWTRDAMDRALSPSAIDHRHPIEVDHPDLPAHPPMHYDRPVLNGGERNVDPPLWTDAGPRREDVRQGVIGDCWALSSMGAVAGHNPDAIRDLVAEDGDGYKVGLHHARREEGSGDWIPTGHRIELHVTREVPHRDDLPGSQAGADVTGTGIAWTSAVEKALAGVDHAWGRQRNRLEFDDARGYARLVGGSEHAMSEVLTQLSGERAGVIALDTRRGHESRVEAMLKAQIDAGHPVVVGTVYASPRQRLPHGLEGSHAYEVVDVRDGIVSLHNPWGRRHPDSMSVRDFLDNTRGKIATTAPDEARKNVDD